MSQEKFIKNHKARAEDFIRKRVLNFGVTLLLILQKSSKSLQIRLNELLMLEKIPYGVTASAYSQARHKLKHTALVELNEYVIKEYYSDDSFKTWQGYRCIGVDASKLVLPFTDESCQLRRFPCSLRCAWKTTPLPPDAKFAGECAEISYLLRRFYPGNIFRSDRSLSDDIPKKFQKLLDRVFSRKLNFK